MIYFWCSISIVAAGYLFDRVSESKYAVSWPFMDKQYLNTFKYPYAPNDNPYRVKSDPIYFLIFSVGFIICVRKLLCT